LSSASAKKLNVLFSSVGRRVELLRAFRAAYRSLNLEGNIVALDIDPLSPALQVADRPYMVPRLDDPQFITRLLEICSREQVGIVFPLTDLDIAVLADARLEVERTGARVAVVSPEAARITSDKWLTYTFFRRLGLPVPDSWVPPQIEPERLDFPVFIKPRFGSAGKGAFKVANSRELHFFLEYVDRPIVQEFLPGPEITTDVICDLDGEVLGVVSRRRLEVRWGEVAKGVTTHELDITRGCIQIARELPAIGPVTVQCVLKGGRPFFTEINARLAGGIPLSIRAGLNSPQLLLARGAGLNIEFPPVDSYSRGLYMTRFDDSYFLTEEELAQMASHRF
jgi:carbamoyl-phosphate synthase large subunit